jgi:hypothetical protein
MYMYMYGMWEILHELMQQLAADRDGKHARTYVTEGFSRGNSLGPLGTKSVTCVHC